ncbi:N-Acetyl-D-glucosamine ABC transport system, permease protein 2 [[Actinomadura] parvosata subsp. kistnae]|nr:N-Acetyl-D-glucosamine ABC transport system, permease protein 2 [Actinomadura parvosata subsp. kistnae]
MGKAENVRVLTVALGIFRSQTPQGSPDWAGLMAATLFAALPIMALFAVLAAASSTPSATPASNNPPFERSCCDEALSCRRGRGGAAAVRMRRPGGARAGRRRPRHDRLLALDTAQQPQYQACADAFHKANPQYTVKITQYGWDDYWNTLTTAFVSGTAPTCSSATCPATPSWPPGPDPPPGRIRHQGQGGPVDLPGRPGRPVGRQGRQTVRAAQGLRHRGRHLQHRPAQEGRIKREWRDWNRDGARTRVIARPTVDKTQRRHGTIEGP